MVRSVTVEVAGQKLGIRTDASDAELRALSALINERVAEIRGASTAASPAKVYLLTALTLADELRRVSAELARLRETVDAEAQGALRFLEEDGSSG